MGAVRIYINDVIDLSSLNESNFDAVTWKLFQSYSGRSAFLCGYIEPTLDVSTYEDAETGHKDETVYYCKVDEYYRVGSIASNSIFSRMNDIMYDIEFQPMVSYINQTSSVGEVICYAPSEFED